MDSKPFSNTLDFAANLWILLLSFISIILNGYAINTIRKQDSDSKIWLVSLLVGDLSIGLIDCFNTLRNVINGGWKGSEIECFIIYTIAISTCYITVFNVSMLGYARLCIFQGSPIPTRTSRRIVVTIWILSLLFTCFPFYTNSFRELIVLQESFIHCEPRFQSSEPLAIAFKLIFLLVGLGCISLVVFWYLRIYGIFTRFKKRIVTLRRVGKKTNETALFSHTSTIQQQDFYQSTKSKIKAQERILLTQTVLIVFSYMACWSSIVITIIYSFGGIIDRNAHLVYNTLIVFNSLLDPLIIIFVSK